MHPDIPVLSPGQTGRPLAISPTDVSQFIRLEQCQRYLRLRLNQAATGRDVVKEYDRQPQAIPPTLTQSGRAFELEVEQAVRDRFATTHFAEKIPGASDNDAVVELAGELAPGDIHVLFQPRLEAILGHWRVRGDVDLIRLERTADKRLQVLIADMKSSTTARVEHRLQVAFYHEMLHAILDAAGLRHDPIDLAIVYRGPAMPPSDPDEAKRQEKQRDAACTLLGATVGFLEPIHEQTAYISAVHDLVLAPRSLAAQVMATPFDDLPFHLTLKCDGCLFNEFCMKQAAEDDDLSLIPHITEGDKAALRRRGVATTTDLARLAWLDRKGEGIALIPAPETETLTRSLAATWPVGRRLQELIHRAHRYRRFQGESHDSVSYIPGNGYASLPYSDATQNPNLVKVYIDVQHDYLNDRLYLLGALITGNEGGHPNPARRRSVVELAPAQPTSHEAEAELLKAWVKRTLDALAEVAAPDAEGNLKAPVHVIFFNAFAQKYLLDALGRHATSVFGATALYDFVTQIAAFTSPIVTQIETQVREHKNYPMVCQSLQAVAAFLKFDWNAGTPYRDLFRTRLFDFWSKLDEPEHGDPGVSRWYTGRARFNSQIPLEYAHAAWGELPPPTPGKLDELADYRPVTPELLMGFHTRRLEAMEHIANDFRGNDKTELTPFDLSVIASFSGKSASMAEAIHEFVTIEQHVELAAWRNERLAEPEQRVLRGQSLILRYVEDDQLPGVAERNRENEKRRILHERQRNDYKAAHPDAKQVRLSKEEKAESDWSQEDITFRLRIEMEGVNCDLDEALRLSTLKADGRFILYPRWVIDGRRPAAGQQRFTPTPKQTLYGLRANVHRFDIRRVDGKAVEAWVELSLIKGYGAGNGPAGFVFATFGDQVRPLLPDELYTLEPDPNNWSGLWGAIVAKGLGEDGHNRLYDLLVDPEHRPRAIHAIQAAGQARFLEGLDALRAAGAMDHGFEKSKREYIGDHADAPLLLVQGPPGTGKSFSTAYALLARIQGAMAAGAAFRVVLSCKTHAATNVLLENVAKAQERLQRYAASHPAVFDAYFDRRLLDLPLYRFRGPSAVHPNITLVPRDDDREKGTPSVVARLEAAPWCVLAATPGGVYRLVKDQWPKDLFGHELVHCLVLDEASQMNIPEAIIAALPLAADGAVIVVGDHRQMPPIVKNDWTNEPRRTFSEFRSYESLFLSLLPLADAVIRFEESFRLHADMAEFLRREVYSKDKINYHSKKHDVLPAIDHGDSFVAAVLNPAYPLVVVMHDEARSQVSNPYEQQLMAPILAVLADPAGHNLRPDNGLGVVVPHRAQRAALQDGVRVLNVYDDHGAQVDSAVDTVERFQGGERNVILIGATESDREYLLVSGKFLLDPRRLTVALSRAKQKLVLVAARSVFEVFSADEETFQNAQLWKNLLRHTCTELLWEGDRHEVNVEVWGNPPTTP